MCAEECRCRPDHFPPTRGLIDNWCTEETCLSGFWLVEIGLGVR